MCVRCHGAGVWAAPAAAQTAEMKEKPRLYTYAANWVIPRSRWEDMEKASTGNQKILDAAVANGTILGYGDDTTVVHQVEGATHDNWWVATSMAGLFNVLDEIHKSKSAVLRSCRVPPSIGTTSTSVASMAGMRAA